MANYHKNIYVLIYDIVNPRFSSTKTIKIAIKKNMHLPQLKIQEMC